MTIFKNGDRVRITYRGKGAFGIVKLASTNGHSLMLEFAGTLGGYLHLLPCLWTERGFVDLIENEVVEVELSVKPPGHFADGKAAP